MSVPAARAALAALGVALGLASLAHGYYDSRIWAPAAIVLAAVLLSATISRGTRVQSVAVIAVGALTALGLWSLASSTWTPSAYDGIVDGNLKLAYAVLLALLVVLLRDRRDATWLLAGLLAGVTVVALAVIGREAFADDPRSLFLGGRLHEPLGYINGQGNVFALAMFLSLGLAEQRRSAVLAGVGAAGVTLFAGLALQSQSRGVVLSALIALVVVLVLVPGRRRRAGVLVVVALSLLIAVPSLLDIFEQSASEDLAELIRTASRRLLLAALVAGAVWSAVVDVGNHLSQRVGRGASLAWAAILAVAVLATGVVGVRSAGAIGDRIDREYDAFIAVSGPAPAADTGSRLVSGSGARYDYWRIAVDVWKSDKLTGAGAGGWVVPYFARRATAEDVRQPHSLPLQTLAELGFVGAVLLALVIGAVLWAMLVRLREFRRSRGELPLLVACVGMGAAWMIHTSVDWMHLLPASTGMVLCAAAVVLRSGAHQSIGDWTAPLPWDLRRGLPYVAAVVLAITVITLTRQALADHYRAGAQDALADRPADALKLANRSLRFRDEALPTYYVKAAALARFGEGAAADRVLRAAIRREPDNFLAHTLRGDLLTRRGRFAEAREAYREALRLNPMDFELQTLARRPRKAP